MQSSQNIDINNTVRKVFIDNELFLTDVASAQIWNEFKGLQNPELKSLAERIPDTVLASRANSTTKKYRNAVERWKKWASQRDLDYLPIAVSKFALYLQWVGETSQSRAAVEEAVNAASWLQRIRGEDVLVSRNPLICSIVEGFQRQLARPKVKKSPVTPGILQEIVASHGLNPSLADLRLAAICLTAYTGFLRFDELNRLRGCDIKIYKEKMELHIIASKTDQYRQGASLLIARTGTNTCPVAMMEKYIATGGIDLTSQEKLFRGIVRTKKRETLRASGSLSYTRMRELVLGKLRELGYDAKKFGLHSFRAGGATAAANAQGVTERNFKRHGRWKSESAKDGYVEDSEESRLLVSKSIGV